MTSHGDRIRRAWARLLSEEGITLTELLAVLVILGIVLASMTTLFVSASSSQTDQNNRFQAQQHARLALEALRREIRCANSITLPMSSSSPPPATISAPASSLTITLGSYCPTAAGQTYATWCTEPVVASQRYALWRYGGLAPASCGVAGGVLKSDHLVSANVFTSYTAPAGGVLGTLRITLPVDVSPADALQRYTLRDDIALRNTRS